MLHTKINFQKSKMKCTYLAIFKIFNGVCACVMCVCDAYMWGYMYHGSLWGTKNSFQKSVTFGNWSQAIRWHSKCSYPLSHSISWVSEYGISFDLLSKFLNEIPLHHCPPSLPLVPSSYPYWRAVLTQLFQRIESVNQYFSNLFF